jgi:hypothetical protein
MNRRRSAYKYNAGDRVLRTRWDPSPIPPNPDRLVHVIEDTDPRVGLVKVDGVWQYAANFEPARAAPRVIRAA